MISFYQYSVYVLYYCSGTSICFFIVRRGTGTTGLRSRGSGGVSFGHSAHRGRARPRFLGIETDISYGSCG